MQDKLQLISVGGMKLSQLLTILMGQSVMFMLNDALRKAPEDMELRDLNKLCRYLRTHGQTYYKEESNGEEKS